MQIGSKGVVGNVSRGFGTEKSTLFDYLYQISWPPDGVILCGCNSHSPWAARLTNALPIGRPRMAKMTIDNRLHPKRLSYKDNYRQLKTWLDNFLIYHKLFNSRESCRAAETRYRNTIPNLGSAGRSGTLEPRYLKSDAPFPWIQLYFNSQVRYRPNN